MSTSTQYTLKVSSRARHVSLRITQAEGLVVVIPVGFDERRIPRILAEKADWIKRTQKRMAHQPKPARPELAHPLPSSIHLPLTGETWNVEYVPSQSRNITLTQPGRRTLRLTGAVGNHSLCGAAFRRWTSRQARVTLPPVLTGLAHEKGFMIGAITIRNQRTRWGSCSRLKSISLNQKLLFLSPDLVRYVMLHELCHTRVMSHSRKFWEQVASHDPDYKRKIKELRDAMKYLPVWA
jgi:predicted metal-dependent hydrolase